MSSRGTAVSASMYILWLFSYLVLRQCMPKIVKFYPIRESYFLNSAGPFPRHSPECYLRMSCVCVCAVKIAVLWWQTLSHNQLPPASFSWTWPTTTWQQHSDYHTSEISQSAGQEIYRGLPTNVNVNCAFIQCSHAEAPLLRATSKTTRLQLGQQQSTDCNDTTGRCLSLNWARMTRVS